jgi:hypothetical protein
MKILEIRLAFANSVDTDALTEFAEEAKESLPVDLEQNGIKVSSTSFRLSELPRPEHPTPHVDVTYEIHMEPSLAYTVERRLMDLAKAQRQGFIEKRGTEVRAKKTRDTLRKFRGAIAILHPTSKIVAAIFLLATLAGGTFGQTVSLPDNPLPHVATDASYQPAPKPAGEQHKFSKRIYFALLAVNGAATTADYITTCHGLDNGGWEKNPVFGRRPSDGRIVMVGAALFAAQSAVLYVTEHNRHKWVRTAGRIGTLAVTEGHAQAAVCNATGCTAYVF